ncbi:hypothetical protein ACA910_005561 [Epithemia clementina (nom. ined.)]
MFEFHGDPTTLIQPHNGPHPPSFNHHNNDNIAAATFRMSLDCDNYVMWTPTTTGTRSDPPPAIATPEEATTTKTTSDKENRVFPFHAELFAAQAHPSLTMDAGATKCSTTTNNNNPENTVVATKRRAGSKKKPKDMPKRPLSAYNLFFAHEKQTILKLQQQGYAQPDFDQAICRQTGGGGGPVLFQALAKSIGARWRALPDGERQKYQQQASQELQKYRIKMNDYHHLKQQKEQGNADSSQLFVGGGNGSTSTTNLAEEKHAAASVAASNTTDVTVRRFPLPSYPNSSVVNGNPRYFHFQSNMSNNNINNDHTHSGGCSSYPSSLASHMPPPVVATHSHSNYYHQQQPYCSMGMAPLVQQQAPGSFLSSHPSQPPLAVRYHNDSATASSSSSQHAAATNQKNPTMFTSKTFQMTVPTTTTIVEL